MPSQIAITIGAAIAPIMTRPRSRGEIRAQKSRARSAMPTLATSHARRVDRELDRTPLGVVSVGPRVTLFLKHSIFLSSAINTSISCLLGRPAEIDLGLVDDELLDVERDLCPWPGLCALMSSMMS